MFVHHPRGDHPDSIYCQRDTTRMITDGGDHYIRTVQTDRHNFHQRVKASSWKDISLLVISAEHGHGRRTPRTLTATDISEGLGFPVRHRCCG